MNSRSTDESNVSIKSQKEYARRRFQVICTIDEAVYTASETQNEI